MMKVHPGNCPETFGTIPHDDEVTFRPSGFSEINNGVCACAQTYI